MARPPKGPGFLLTEEECNQKDGEMYQLLEAQPQFDCQLEHGNSLVCAGRPANLLRVGFGEVRSTVGHKRAASFLHLTEVLRSPPGIAACQRRGFPVAGCVLPIHGT